MQKGLSRRAGRVHLRPPGRMWRHSGQAIAMGLLTAACWCSCLKTGHLRRVSRRKWLKDKQVAYTCQIISDLGIVFALAGQAAEGAVKFAEEVQGAGLPVD